MQNINGRYHIAKYLKSCANGVTEAPQEVLSMFARFMFL